MVREDHGWHAFFCKDPDAGVVEILVVFADRAIIELLLHDLKEVWGTGQLLVRNIWTKFAVYNLKSWMRMPVELWSWTKSHNEILERNDSP